MSQLLDAVATNQAVGAVVFAAVGAALSVWLAAAWWTYGDLSRRVQTDLVPLLAPAWILVSTPVLLPLALTAYLLVRPQETLVERRSREILGALAPPEPEGCPTCGLAIDEGWRRCPTCTTWLGAPCSRCGRWSPTDLELCPYCAVDRSSGDESAPALPGPSSVVTSGHWRGQRSEGRPRPALRDAQQRARVDRRAGRAAPVPGPRLARLGR